jgi:hypothetical protein
VGSRGDEDGKRSAQLVCSGGRRKTYRGSRVIQRIERERAGWGVCVCKEERVYVCVSREEEEEGY